jgi:glucose/arabinose dehydrogenase
MEAGEIHPRNAICRARLHPQTGVLWFEHGPQGGDKSTLSGRRELWLAGDYGVNYGIALIGEGSRGRHNSRSTTGSSIAPSGMAFYTGDRFPEWKGNLFVGALKDQMLVRLVLDGEKVVKEERLLKGVLGRIRDVRNGPDGYLYLLTDESRGVLARLEP